jgi:DNA-binding response OmpR family regulator/anti-sigma regulatory factor (Ser/Thr protein kinase)
MTEQALAHVGPQLATLLVVEDDPDIQAMLHNIFSNAGYTVFTASSGREAINALHQQPIDLVVLDVLLPDQNGYEVCEQVRNNGGSRLPIVMLTALTQPRNVMLGLEAGADDYVRKPFVPEELLLRVQRLLQWHDEIRSAESEAAHLRDLLELVQRQLSASRDETTVETTLRREFLHNVTTHMQALSGIVDAAIRKLPPSPEREVVQQLKGRVRGAALVYEISEALQHDQVEVGSLIRTIASALKSMYRPWRRVRLTVEGTALHLPLAVASPLAMIVNELVTNCFKHAFPDNRFGAISIRYGVQHDTFELTVEDDGVGFDSEQTSFGRGRTTVNQLAESLHGAIDWHSDGTGTRIRLTLPL